MPDEALQTAFEIKTTCDEISRKLLRWHWENKPGEHSLGALLDHIRTRQQESPEYYDRLPDLAGRNSSGSSWIPPCVCGCCWTLKRMLPARWICWAIRSTPLLPAGACNAVRTARNEAAHASDRTAAAQAAILFNEAVEALEEGYAGAPLRTSELGQYYRLAEDYLSRCGAKKPIASAAPEEKAPRAAKSGQSAAGRKKRGLPAVLPAAAAQSRTRAAAAPAADPRTGSRAAAGTAVPGPDRSRNRPIRTVLLVLLAILAVGLLIRGFTMNWQ